MIVEIKASLPLGEFDAAVSKNPVLIFVKATWCGPCRNMAETVVDFSAGGFPVLKVDVDECPHLVSRLGVKEIPAFLVYKHGKEVKRHTGAMTKSELIALTAAE